MKKSILIQAFEGKGWVGGLYYKKNIIFSLLQNCLITEKYNIVVVTYPENRNVFRDLEDNIIIKTVKPSGYHQMEMKELLICLRYHCKYIFPCENIHYKHFGIRLITWFPDFQHNCLPYYFNDDEIRNRTVRVEKIIDNNIPLILSSNDCLKDFKKYYSEQYTQVSVVPFVSYIEPVIRGITQEQEEKILKKYELKDKKYACIMNQFWQHKNHIVVFEALLKYFRQNPKSNFIYVFTGKMEDYRCPEYILKLKSLLEETELRNHVKLLGFLERDEQILLMKNAEYLIQPSLFEGWGTVLEDAKVLDKTVLLSDIPVHQEQKNEKCILFSPHDADELANIIDRENRVEHFDNISAGIDDMRKRALEYSKEFQKLLCIGEK